MDFSTLQLTAAFLLLFFVSLLPIIFIGIIIRRKWRNKLKYAFIIPLSIIQLSIFYAVFTALYPTDSFYMEKYKTAIGSPAPPSANVVKKSASYPDFHGDYYALFMMELSASDYKKLYKKIIQNKSFNDADLINSTEVDNFLNKEQRKKIITTKQRYINKEDEDCYIAFFNDRQSILIYYINP